MAKPEPNEADLQTSLSTMLELARGGIDKTIDEKWRGDLKSVAGVNWALRSLQTQELFKEFTIDAVTTPHAKVVIDSLFSALCGALGATPEEKPQQNVLVGFLFTLFQNLCWRVPTSVPIIAQVVFQNQPILRRTPQTHSGFCSAVLYLSICAKLIRRQLISTVVSHVLLLDVRLPREMVLVTSKNPQRSQEHTDLITKLDLSVEAVCNFIDKLPEVSASSEEPAVFICNFFSDLLAAFDAAVFRSTSASHINFILFYACSRFPELTASILDHLWSRIMAEDKADESRQSALFYFASFVARAKFMALDQLRTAVEHLTQFAHLMRSKTFETPNNGSIVNEQQAAAAATGRMALFDSAVESLIYVIAFHHKTLCTGSLGFRFIRSLHLGDLINHPSDPLSRCRESVVGMFLQVADYYHLSLTDRMSRNSCRTESMCSIASTPGDSDLTESPMLLAAAAGDAAIAGSSFFPFDPCMLPKSKEKIKPFYVEFDGSDLLVSSSDSDNAMDSDDFDDDDDDEQLGFEDMH